MKLLEVSSKTALFLKSINVDDINLLDEIVWLATNEHISSLSNEQINQLKEIISSKKNTVNCDGVKRYTTAQLGCNLVLSKNNVESLLLLAGFITKDGKNTYLTESGKDYGVLIEDKIMWLQSVNKVLRKLK